MTNRHDTGATTCLGLVELVELVELLVAGRAGGCDSRGELAVCEGPDEQLASTSAHASVDAGMMTRPMTHASRRISYMLFRCRAAL
ncbi:MAG: hypothetical protein M0010_01485 [Actinomycetota bacterium]|jgi:hypothetical protein|nr:hypothetical protein [Actinomycetota bacterium]